MRGRERKEVRKRVSESIGEYKKKMCMKEIGDERKRKKEGEYEKV